MQLARPELSVAHTTPQAQRAAPTIARSPGAIEGAKGEPQRGAQAFSRSPRLRRAAGLGGSRTEQHRGASATEEVECGPSRTAGLGGEAPLRRPGSANCVSPCTSRVQGVSRSRRASRARGQEGTAFAERENAVCRACEAQPETAIAVRRRSRRRRWLTGTRRPAARL